MKKILAIVLSVCMIVTLAPMSVFADGTTGSTDATTQETPTTDSGGTVDGGADNNGAGGGTEAAEPVAQVGETKYSTLAAAIDAVGETTGTTVTLLKDVTEELSAPSVGEVTIDLNGKTFTMNNKGTTFINSGKTLIIKNGNLVAKQISGGTKATFQIESGGTVTLDNVKFDTKGSALYPKGDAAAVNVINSSEIKCGVFAIGTNASSVDNYGVVITLRDSTFISTYGDTGTDGDSCPVMINIPGKLNMTNCTVNGTRQGVVVRGGTADIENSTINLNADYEAGENKYWNGNWGSGDEVPMAALVVGNRASSYVYPATCTVNNTKISATSGYKAIYAYEMKDEKDDRSVTLNINGAGTNVSGEVKCEADEGAAVAAAITGGTYTVDPSAYLGAGYIATYKNGVYTVTEKSAIAAEVATPVVEAASEVSADDYTDESQKSAVEATITTIVGNGETEARPTEIAELQTIANSIANENTVTVEEAKAALTKEGITVEEGNGVKIVVVPTIEVTLNDVQLNENNTVTEITVDITPVAKTVATTATTTDAIKIADKDVADANAVVIGDSEKMTITEPVTMQIPLPANFADAGSTLYITHEKTNRTYKYPGTVGEMEDALYVEFTNPHGFSAFKIAAAGTGAPVAMIGNVGYTSLQDAVDEVTNGQTIKLMKDGETATVNRTVNFTVDPAETGGSDSYTYTINLGNRCSNSSSEANVYNITYRSSSSSSSNGGNGGSAATTSYKLTFDTNGGSAVSSISKTKDTTVDLAEYKPTREGYTFEGWYSDSALTEKITSVKLTANTTVYAKWTENGTDTPSVPDDTTGGTAGTGFTDVTSGDWFKGAVDYAVANGLFTGTSATTFGPNQSMTRGMLVTVLYRLEKTPAITGTCKFTDVSSSDYFNDAVIWASENGVVTGMSDTVFAPNTEITREQMAAILYRYATLKNYDLAVSQDGSASFTDWSNVSDYAVTAMNWAVSHSLITGMGDGTVAPKGDASRAQVAAIFQRFNENIVK